MPCARLDVIVKQQSVGQAAYRKGFSTDDHLLVVGLVFELCSEWNVDVRLGIVDFQKAFDTVEHASLWQALAEHGVSAEFVDVLRALYSNQVATVGGDSGDRVFSIERGVKQGDQISPLLFLSVMEAIFRRLRARWVSSILAGGASTIASW